MSGYKKWDEADRKKTMDPENILPGAGLKPGMVIVDIGCGQGYFAIPAARIVGKSGKVYGIDIDGEAVAHLNDKAAAAGLKNIHTAVGGAEGTVICDGCADIVFFGICLHDFEDPGVVLANARKMLKPGGTLVNLDWKKIRDTEGGPPYEIRFSEQKASQLIGAAGFKVESIEDVGGRYYLIKAR
jgi:ubiquinone/menaquinone biosynthesis C-methylase UbiE